MDESPYPASRQTLTIREMADALGISLPTAYAAVRNGSVPSVRIGTKWLVPRAAFEALLRGDPRSAPGAPARTDRSAA